MMESKIVFGICILFIATIAIFLIVEHIYWRICEKIFTEEELREMENESLYQEWRYTDTAMSFEEYVEQRTGRKL